MPGKVKVKIVAGRNLPVMDRSSDTTDAFVEIRHGEVTYKTDVYRKSLNPAWNSEWFRFEADDLELQDEPLQVRIMDYDTYSANDAVGKVYIDLNPLLLPSTRPTVSEKMSVTSTSGGGIMSGWLPIFDTMHGVRGELNLIVKVELFSDLNKFRQSSCGVHFFSTSEVPEGYKLHNLPGFVEELVVNDDPEYKWIDKIRTPRASNEARQLLFMKLSGEVRRKIGLKVLELGANAVIGYRQLFDIEGESGIAVRGIGTAVTLTRIQLDAYGNFTSQISPGTMSENPNSPRGSRENSAGKEMRCSVEGKTELSLDSPPPVTNLQSTSWTNATPKRSRDISISKATEIDLGTSRASVSVGSGSLEKIAMKFTNSTKTGDTPDMAEFPFLTMNKFSPGFLSHIGGMVSAKSVKLLEELDERDDGDTREGWWTEIRQEVRSHARALGCNVIIGYQEKTVIWDDVIILSVSGTGAVSNISFLGDLDSSGLNNSSINHRYLLQDVRSQGECNLCHIPYSESSVPFPIRLGRCNVCERGKVPDILLTTIEPPPQLEIIGRGGIIQARVIKAKKELKNENNAREVSDLLPFLEYELHRQIVNKLKVNGMNAIFGLQVNLGLSDRTIVAIATGTALYLAALPPPAVPKITSSSNMFTDQSYLTNVQNRLTDRIQANKAYYGIDDIHEKDDTNGELEDSVNDMELSSGNKDTCVLEVDDTEDADVVEGLLDVRPPDGVQVITLKTPVGVDTSQPVTHCQTFTQVAKGRQTNSSRELAVACNNLMASIYFKLRKLRPCLLSALQWEVRMDEDSEIQLQVSGVAIRLQPPLQHLQIQQPPSQQPSVNSDTENGVTRENGSKTIENGGGGSSNSNGNGVVAKGDSDLMFNLEELQEDPEHSTDCDYEQNKKQLKLMRLPQYFLSTNREMFGINVTPLPYIPGARIEHHLGNLNFFLIRESTSVREMGGLGIFVQGFMAEVLGILRAHVASLGGNAVVSYFMSEYILSHSSHKNQAQCLINVGGDCVFTTYITHQDIQ